MYGTQSSFFDNNNYANDIDKETIMRDLRTKKKGIKCLKKNVVIKSSKNLARPFIPSESINSKESIKTASNQEL